MQKNDVNVMSDEEDEDDDQSHESDDF